LKYAANIKNTHNTQKYPKNTEDNTQRIYEIRNKIPSTQNTQNTLRNMQKNTQKNTQRLEYAKKNAEYAKKMQISRPFRFTARIRQMRTIGKQKNKYAEYALLTLLTP
jgi:hypothetical protein